MDIPTDREKYMAEVRMVIENRRRRAMEQMTAYAASKMLLEGPPSAPEVVHRRRKVMRTMKVGRMGALASARARKEQKTTVPPRPRDTYMPVVEADDAEWSVAEMVEEIESV